MSLVSRSAHVARTLALAVTIPLVVTALPAGSAWAAGSNPDRTWRPWVCAWSEKEVATTESRTETDEGVIALDAHVLCWLQTVPPTESKEPENPVVQAAVDAFLGRTGMSLEEAREHQLAAVLCHDGGVGATTVGQGLPTLDAARESCQKPVVPPSGTGSGGGDRETGIVPDIFGNNAGMPQSGNIRCSAQGAANPFADGTDGGVPTPPRTSDGEIAMTFVGSWATGTATMYGTAKGGASATSQLGTGVAIGAGSAGLVAWGNAAATALGNLMDARYRDAAQGLAEEAAGFALGAEANAQAAEGYAAASGDPGAAAEAAKARQAANDAKRAAEAAAAAAKQAAEAKTRAEVAAAYDAAKKADAEAKKKNEEAAKAKAAAEKKANNASGSGAPVNPGTGTGTGTGSTGSTNGTPARTAESTCESLRRQVWECEQSGWKTFGCQELARMLQGCQVDHTVALVDGDSAVCGTPSVSTEEVVAAAAEACGALVAHPMPGVDPCSLVVEGSPQIRGDCDPTIAYGGCPDEPDVVLHEDDTVCFPAPPGAPPMPCVDPTPGGSPVVHGPRGGGLRIGGFLQDSFGGVYAVGSGGIVALGVGYPPRFP